MIPETDDRQLTFLLPFGGRLKPENRWVQLAEVVPWPALESAYNAVMNPQQGRPSKPARLVIGAMIIKHKLSLSDEETVQQIQENPYLQYFCGYEAYSDAKPFVSSLFVEIRKRMGADMFHRFEQAIANQAVAIQKQRHRDKDKDDRTLPPAAGNDESPSENPCDAPEPVTHHGRLLMDATVADQMIGFPTDLKLLNSCREISESIVDELHQQLGGKKPRTYREQARKAYLAISKRRKPSIQLIRKAIRKQLQYIRRDLNYVDAMLSKLMPVDGMPFPLPHPLQRRYWIIQHVYAQQKEMYDSKSRRCSDRIVSISQPHVRPIIRGKAGRSVEFGSKLSVSMAGKLAFVDRVSWDAFNEAGDLIAQVQSYKQRFGFFPKVVHADGIYGTRNNRKFLKDNGIRFAGKPVGRPRKQSQANKAEISQLKRQRREDERLRIPVEGKFGQGKNGYRLNQIRARLASTSEAWIRSIFMVMNLMAIIRFLLPVWATTPIRHWQACVLRDYRQPVIDAMNILVWRKGITFRLSCV